MIKLFFIDITDVQGADLVADLIVLVIEIIQGTTQEESLIHQTVAIQILDAWWIINTFDYQVFLLIFKVYY